MSDLLEKLRPSRIKRELLPIVIISIITISSFIYFSYQDSFLLKTSLKLNEKEKKKGN